MRVHLTWMDGVRDGAYLEALLIPVYFVVVTAAIMRLLRRYPFREPFLSGMYGYLFSPFIICVLIGSNRFANLYNFSEHRFRWIDNLDVKLREVESIILMGVSTPVLMFLVYIVLYCAGRKARAAATPFSPSAT